MATPYVAGAASVLVSANMNLSSKEIKFLTIPPFYNPFKRETVH